MSSVLLLSCPDQPGIVAATAQAIADNGGNIVHAEQYVKADDADSGAAFFQRVVFDHADDTTTDDHYLGRFDPRYATQQYATTTTRFFQRLSACLNRHASSHF